MNLTLLRLSSAILFLLGTAIQAAQDKPAPTPDVQAFAALKSLAGQWEGRAGSGETAFPMTIIYRLASGGTVVQETLFPETPHEMISMYHLDHGKLVMTHYCAMGNQPKMKLESFQDGEMVFGFVGGTNLDPEKDMHIHAGTIKLRDANHLEANWDFYQGKEKGGTHSMVVQRKSPLPLP